MFEFLSSRLQRIQKNLFGQATIRQSSISDALREVKIALLEADVTLPVVRELTESISQKALGQQVLDSITPAQTFINIVHDELVALMQQAKGELALNNTPPIVIMMVGLQGGGKTTSTAKLGYWLREKKKKKVLVVSCDVYRPAAREQLQIMAQAADISYFICESNLPEEIVREGLLEGEHKFYDVVIIDTAGRQDTDKPMLAELKKVHDIAKPQEVIFVVDALLGQSSVEVATTFHQTIPITGVLLSKMDADARGGSLLSLWHTLSLPVKFCGTSEKITGLADFDPSAIASQILGKADIVSFVKKVQQHEVSQKKNKSVKTKKKMDLNSFREQIVQVRQMGNISELMSKLPAHMMPKHDLGDLDKKVRLSQGIIDSMTVLERRNPEIIKASRKRRIAAGAGTTVQEVNKLLTQFLEAQQMFKAKSNSRQKFPPFFSNTNC